jgi:broad specificity phosphatase PhoE
VTSVPSQPPEPQGHLVLLRHGETEWSKSGQHTGVTDLPLLPEGEEAARRVAVLLSDWTFDRVLVSPLQRARRTAELAGLGVTAIDEDLAEWAYGEYEGVTTAEIRRQRPDWLLWRDGCPGGESPEQVAARLDRVLVRAERAARDGDVALLAHGHSLRVAGVRWLGLAPSYGAGLVLDTATLSLLGHEHGERAIRRWNAPPA